jgi:hypothetical protein
VFEQPEVRSWTHDTVAMLAAPRPAARARRIRRGLQGRNMVKPCGKLVILGRDDR